MWSPSMHDTESQIKRDGFLKTLVEQELQKHYRTKLVISLLRQDSDPNSQPSLEQGAISSAAQTAWYEDLLKVVPDLFVGSQSRIKDIVKLLTRAMALAFNEQGCSTPPWRSSAALLSKWLPKRVGTFTSECICMLCMTLAVAMAMPCLGPSSLTSHTSSLLDSLSSDYMQHASNAVKSVFVGFLWYAWFAYPEIVYSSTSKRMNVKASLSLSHKKPLPDVMLQPAWIQGIVQQIQKRSQDMEPRSEDDSCNLSSAELQSHNLSSKHIVEENVSTHRNWACCVIPLKRRIHNIKPLVTVTDCMLSCSQDANAGMQSDLLHPVSL